MEWFYAIGNEQKGPVMAPELLAMRASGRIADDTLVWRDGMADWIPFRHADVAVAETGEGTAARAGGAEAAGEAGEEMGVCAYSGRRMPKSRMVAYGDNYLAPEHKDAFVQRLREGAMAGDPMELVPADYVVDLGSAVRRAWALLQSDFWPIVGISILVFIAYAAATNLPLIGAIASMLLMWPILAGLFYYYLRKMRGEPAAIEHAFAGFSRNFSQLVLLNLVQSLIALAAMLPGIVLLVIGIFTTGRVEGAENTALAGIAVAGIILMLVPAIYLYVAWMFAPLLVIDKLVPFWPAMQVSMKTVHKHLAACLWFTFVIGLLSAAGALALCLGFLVTWPLSAIAMTYLYEDVYGRRGAHIP